MNDQCVKMCSICYNVYYSGQWRWLKCVWAVFKSVNFDVYHYEVTVLLSYEEPPETSCRYCVPLRPIVYYSEARTPEISTDSVHQFSNQVQFPAKRSLGSRIPYLFITSQRRHGPCVAENMFPNKNNAVQSFGKFHGGGPSFHLIWGGVFKEILSGVPIGMASCHRNETYTERRGLPTGKRDFLHIISPFYKTVI